MPFKPRRPSICHFCDTETEWWEEDHFPIPFEVGGESTVVACMLCHDMKDRGYVTSIHLPALIEGVQELIASGVQFILDDAEGDPDAGGSVMGLPLMGEVRLVSYGKQPDSWDDLGHVARVVWAKAAALSARLDQRAGRAIPGVGVVTQTRKRGKNRRDLVVA